LYQTAVTGVELVLGIILAVVLRSRVGVSCLHCGGACTDGEVASARRRGVPLICGVCRSVGAA
jgi:hypothetical protein